MTETELIEGAHKKLHGTSDMGSIFKSLHGMLEEEWLIPITKLPSDIKGKYQLTDDIIKEIVHTLNIEEENLFYNHQGGIFSFCYWDQLYFHSFFHLQGVLMENSLELEQFNHQRHFFEKLKREEEWEKIIDCSEKKVSFLVFFRLRKEMSKEKQKAVFLRVYSRNEYGFNRLSNSLIREILDYPFHEEMNVPPEYEKDAGGYYTIYRGYTEESSPIEKAFSWTLDKKVAEYFSERFDGSGGIYTGKVNEKHLKAIITGRGESEVLVFPEDVVLMDSR